MSQTQQFSEVKTVSYQNSSEGYATKKIHRYPEEHSKGLKCKQNALQDSFHGEEGEYIESLESGEWYLPGASLQVESEIWQPAKKSLKTIHDRLNKTTREC